MKSTIATCPLQKSNLQKTYSLNENKPIFVRSVCSNGFGHSGAEIVITGNDTMQFDLKAFEVKAGEKVSLTLKNTENSLRLPWVTI